MACDAMERDSKTDKPKSQPRRFERSRGGPARAISELMPEIGRTIIHDEGVALLMNWGTLARPEKHCRNNIC